MRLFALQEEKFEIDCGVLRGTEEKRPPPFFREWKVLSVFLFGRTNKRPPSSPTVSRQCV